MPPTYHTLGISNNFPYKTNKAELRKAKIKTILVLLVSMNYEVILCKVKLEVLV